MPPRRRAETPDLASRCGPCGGLDPGRQERAVHVGSRSYADFTALYTLRRKAACPKFCRCGAGKRRSFSPDATRIAYVPNMKWQAAWKRYNGGQTTPIYIVRLSDLALEKVPRENSNDSQPGVVRGYGLFSLRPPRRGVAVRL